MLDLFPKKQKPTIIVVTQDFSGLGFCQMVQNAGYPCILAYKPKEDEDNLESYEMVGEDMVEKVALDKLFKYRGQHKNDYWLFDQNIFPEYADKLRAEGFKVLGGNKLCHQLEHDRQFGIQMVEKAGVNIPPTFEFKDVQSGLDFLDQNPDKAYVFKPDDGAGTWTTYVPDAFKPDRANRELYDYLSSNDGDTGTYILQERKDGVEVNIEYFLYKGKPFFAHANFESKRKLNKDEGEMCGCSQDIDFIVPLDCKLAKQTVAKLLALPEFKDYTGPLDMNIIVCDNQYWFLEFCARQGYNSSPNLFVNLAITPFPEILINWMDGDVKDFYKHFRYGFGATVSLRIDHPKKGYPIYIPEDMEKKFFFFDQYRDGDKYLLAGYGEEVGIVCAHNYTIQTAAEQALRDVDRINYPCHSCRTDLDKKDYESSPQLRYEALMAQHMFERE